jgi:C4-type Zn-finger protein
MLKYVEKGKVNKLNKLLTSFSSELQTIGAIGLIMEDELNERQKTIIPHLKDRNSQIYSCGVCSYRYNEPFSHRIYYF